MAEYGPDQRIPPTSLELGTWRLMNFKVTLAELLKRFSAAGVEVVLSGGLALSTMGIFRFTKDIDFVVLQESTDAVDGIMKNLGYEMQNFSSAEIRSYLSPLKVFGQVDFLIARRKYSRDMVKRAVARPILDGELTVKVLLPEDLIGLKLQALINDPKNRSGVDAPDREQIKPTLRQFIEPDPTAGGRPGRRRRRAVRSGALAPASPRG
jgi:hypothetical protein